MRFARYQVWMDSEVASRTSDEASRARMDSEVANRTSGEVSWSHWRGKARTLLC